MRRRLVVSHVSPYAVKNTADARKFHFFLLSRNSLSRIQDLDTPTGKKSEPLRVYSEVITEVPMNTLSKTRIAHLEIRAHNEGPAFDLFGVRFLTKAEGNSTNKAFYIAEMLLPAGACVPLHHHSEPEFFYVLAGECEFGTLRNGSEQWAFAEAGYSVLIPLDMPHGLRNMSGADARLLMITTHRHELFFQEAGAAADLTKQPRAATNEELEHVIRTAARHHTYAVMPETSLTEMSLAVSPTLRLIPRCYWQLEPIERPHDFML
jgi:quercetin dioxygenase-like cupin family protein